VITRARLTKWRTTWRRASSKKRRELVTIAGAGLVVLATGTYILGPSLVGLGRAFLRFGRSMVSEEVSVTVESVRWTKSSTPTARVRGTREGYDDDLPADARVLEDLGESVDPATGNERHRVRYETWVFEPAGEPLVEETTDGSEPPSPHEPPRDPNEGKDWQRRNVQRYVLRDDGGKRYVHEIERPSAQAVIASCKPKARCILIIDGNGMTEGLKAP